MLNYVLDYIPYIIIALCLIYPLKTIIYNNFQYFFKNKKNIDVVSAGGFIPFLRILHGKQGATVTSNLPFENAISVVNSKVMKETLNIGDRPIEVFKFLEPFLGKDNLQVFDADKASRFRKLTGSAFGKEVLQTKYESMRSVGIDFIKKLETSLNLQDNVIIRMQEKCLEFSLRVTVKTLTSADTPQDLDFNKFKDSYDALLSDLFDKQFGILDDRREKEFQHKLDFFRTTLDMIIYDNKKRNTERETENIEKSVYVKDFLDILVTENDPETGLPFSDERIRTFMSAYLVAGYHTTGVAIPLTLLALTQNPEVKTKLQEEIDETLQDRSPTFEDLSKMEYLTQVVKETLRIHPPAPFSARLIKKEKLPKELQNLKPKAENITLIYCIPLYHENPLYFTNPKKFDPSRFSRENIKNIKPNTYCPFGFGARICPAERFATVEIKMMVCMILQKFDIELAMALEEVEMEERFNVMAKNDILIKLKTRGRNA